MSSAPDSRNPVEVLAEEFLSRLRRGEDVSPERYAAEYPDRADEILALFPALMMMEDLGGDSGDPTASIVSGGGAVTGVISGRLGDFRLLREIGRGGMGVVYEAEEESLGRRVALKILPAAALADEKQVGRFEREARSAARLHHTNIVPVFGVGNHEGTHFYAMQFIEGQGLDAVLEELKQMRQAWPAKPGLPSRSHRQRSVADIAMSLATGKYAAEGNDAPIIDHRTAQRIATPPPAARPSPSTSDSNQSSVHGQSSVAAFSETDRRYSVGVARIGVQVAEALAHAHGQGILHRDIKPSNLLLDREGTVWVADFGLAKATGADDLTHTGDIVGTVRYMAPERFWGEGDARADIYALGLTLYEMLALRPAFDETDRNGLIRQVTQDGPPRLRKLNRSIPPDLETVVHKAMSREPGQRYSSAGAFAEDLKRFIEGRSILARRVSSSERAYQWCKRNPAIAGLLGTVAVLLVAGSVASTWAAFHFRRIAESERLARAEGALALRQAVEARTEAVKQSRSAEAHFGRARKAVDESFTAVSESKLLNVPGLRALRADLLASSMKFYEEFLRERGDDASLRDDLLRTRLRMAEVLKELGRSKEASEAFRATVAGYQQALRDRPDDLDLKAGLADALPGIGGGMPHDDWIATVRRVVALREDVSRGRPADRRSKQNLGLAYSRLHTQLGESHRAEALAALERSVAIRLELAEEFPDDPDAVEGAFTAFFKLAWATESTQSLALYRRALVFGRESLRLRPNDSLTANDFLLTAQGAVDQLSILGRTDEAISELRRSVKTLEEMARGNPDTPRIQELYLRISQGLANRLAEQKKPGEAARALLETRIPLERLSRDTAADIARAAGWSLDIVRRLGEIQPDLTPEQQAQRDELLDRAVSDYRAAVAGGWKDVALIKDAKHIRDRPGYPALLAEAESAASRPEKPVAPGRPDVAFATSTPAATVPRPKLDAKLDRAATVAALGAARARAGLIGEALASMSKARALFDDLARERPGDPEVTRGRIDARLGDYAALQTLALDRLRHGKTEESVTAQKMAEDVDAELAREQPNDAEVAAARRRALHDFAEFRREASRRGEIYLALYKEESSARELAHGASAGSSAARDAVAGLSRVAHGYGKLALWDEAAAAIRTAYEIDPVGLQDVDGAWDKGYFAWYRVSVLLLQGGETKAYERLRETLFRETLLRENAAGNLRSPLDQIRIATLRANPRSDWKPVLDLAETIPENNVWGQTVRGFALLRAGRDRDALDRFKKDSEWINAWPARAIAHHRLGQAATAREWLARADQRLREDLDEALAGVGFTQTGWTSWWDDCLLRMIWTREAHEFIEGKVWPDATWMRQQRARALARVGEAK